jgi:spore coat protein CotH
MLSVLKNAWLPLIVVVLAPNSTPHVRAQKPGKQSTAFFKSDKIVHLEIEIDKKELDALRRDPRKYAKATLKEGKDVYPNIGIHVKGAAGSFRGIDDKPGLTLNMNKFDEDKLFHGMDKWHLANSVQDPSYLSELICGELFRAAGVPASRVHHAVVTINGRKRGLYYLKEGYDKYFLRQYFKNADGNLYDGGFLREIDQPLQLLHTKGDVKDRADLKALTKAAQEPNQKTRFERLEKLLDMDKFISYLVLESITWDWDGYPINRNNYRIYHEPKVDKIVFIPSGMDQMFGNPGGPIMPGFQGLVARVVMETPEGRKRYLARMSEINKKVFVPDTLIKRLDELQARVQPELAKIDKGAGQDFPNQVNRLRNGIRERAKSIEQQLKTAK